MTSDINALLVDSRGLLWIGGNSPLGYFAGQQFYYTDNHDPNTGKVLYSHVEQIVEDKEGTFWLLTDGGLFHFDSRTLKYERIPLSPEEETTPIYPVRQLLDLDETGRQKLVLTEGYGVYVVNNETKTVDVKESNAVQDLVQEGFVTTAAIDAQGCVWLARITRSLTCIDFERKEEKEVKMTPEARTIISTHLINKMLEVPERNALYLATGGGMLKYDYSRQILTTIPGALFTSFISLVTTDDGKLLAGTDSRGLWVIDSQDNVRLSQLYEPVFDLTMAKVKDIVKDRQGNLLIALMQKGIYVIPKRSDEFIYTPISMHADGRNTSCVTSLDMDTKGNYWIATDGAGVFYADKNNLDAARPMNEGLRSLQIQGVVVDKHNTVWAGSYGRGVQCYTPDGKEKGFVMPDWLQPMQSMAVMSLFYDREADAIYVSTNGMGAYRIDIQQKRVHRMTYDNGQSAWNTCIYVDSDSTVWICEVADVYYTNDKLGRRGKITRSTLPGAPTCITSIGRGADKRIIIGTNHGILVYTPNDGTMQELLNGERVMSINHTDRDIWVATSNSVKAINIQTMAITEFKNFGGFFLGEFHKRATLRNSEGRMLWGCDNGILSFLPRIMREPHTLQSKVIFTGFVVGGKFARYSEDQNILDAEIPYAKKVSLPSDLNTFSISFCIPDFGESPNTTYEYRLEGVDGDWNTTPLPRIQYSKLPAGNYVLHVRACIDEKGVPETEQTIEIHVAAPWYKSIWAYCFYLLAALTLCAAIQRMIGNKRARALELQALHHNEELKEAKLRLFTNITHELRTPLTMIVTPLRHLLSSTEDDELRSNLEIMQHNCNRLQNIVQQITDIRKIDAGQFQLHFQEEDICQYSQNIAQSFLGAAAVKRLQFTIENSKQQIYVWIDPIHFEKVLVNILSNAFKFSPEGGRVKLRNRKIGNNLEIGIYNEGEHISKADMTRLYERFFQAENGQAHMGSGIGLNLCYELVQLHHGTIEARNVEPTGVEFVIRLPLGHEHLSPIELEPRTKEQNFFADNQQTENEHIRSSLTDKLAIDATEEGDTEEETSKHKARILIVDDDKDICDYLSEQLQKDYNITLAFGGNKAWELVLQNRPDLVVTDVKMPDGDGIELARRIKSNPELDNIPIIMVTGEDSDSLHLQSLQINVDHYLQKPFNLSILKGAISQTLRIRENLRKHTKRTDFGYDYDKIEINSAEEALFQRITKTLQAHLDDSEYGVRELSEEVGISRVHLNRKMKEHYGVSPNTFIKAYRLKQAAYLLVRNKVNVSEVAYKVGFNTHSHFSASFRDFFGMSPKEFIVFYTQEDNEEALKKLLE